VGSPGSLAVEVPDALDGHALVHAVGVGADLRRCRPSRVHESANVSRRDAECKSPGGALVEVY
jgi:hypothetical protein